MKEITKFTEQDMINEGYADGLKSCDFMIDKIFSAFDFEKVYKVMKSLDWVWQMGNEKYGIPNINTIKLSAKSLLEKVYEQRKGTISTGGFTAGFDGGLWLEFTLESQHSEDC